VTRIDHLWTTHYHGDHVGALLALAKQVPVMHFYDHGVPHAGDRIVSAAFLSSYDELSRGKRTIVKPGDTLRMTGLDITAVASANRFLRSNPARRRRPERVLRRRATEGRERLLRSRQRRIGRLRPGRTAASARSISATSPGTASSI
jgi:L-ascorbate metabolism protein UlaG (beta-lactamase superfamily)